MNEIIGPDLVGMADAYYEAQDVAQAAIDAIRDDLWDNPGDVVAAMTQADTEQTLTLIFEIVATKGTTPEKYAAILDIWEDSVEQCLQTKGVI